MNHCTTNCAVKVNSRATISFWRLFRIQNVGVFCGIVILLWLMHTVLCVDCNSVMWCSTVYSWQSVSVHCFTSYQICLQVLDPEFRKPFLNVTRWFTTMVNQPQFKSVVGDIVLASKMAVSDGQCACHFLRW